jgi:hypothetical protein
VHFAVKPTKRAKAILSVLKSQICFDCSSIPVKSCDVGEIEPVLGEIGGALPFVPFELHPVSVARKIALAIFYVLQKVKASP